MLSEERRGTDFRCLKNSARKEPGIRLTRIETYETGALKVGLPFNRKDPDRSAKKGKGSRTRKDPPHAETEKSGG